MYFCSFLFFTLVVILEPCVSQSTMPDDYRLSVAASGESLAYHPTVDIPNCLISFDKCRNFLMLVFISFYQSISIPTGS